MVVAPAGLTEVELHPLDLEQFQSILSPEKFDELLEGRARAQEIFAGRTIWNLNSTAKGGGVAEMLASLLAYASGAGVTARWLVIRGNDEFFRITKRIHNRLHGDEGDGGPLGDDERRIYEETLGEQAEEVLGVLGSDDIVLLHDPQTAGLAPALSKKATVVWRCHIGVDHPNDVVRSTWDFLRPYLTHASGWVFSRRQYVWDGFDGDATAVIPPSIDAFSPKNQPMEDDTALAILSAAGVIPDESSSGASFTRRDLSKGHIEARAEMIETDPVPPGAPLVVQVSRWDRLKDPVGVLRGFADHVADSTDAHLVVAGPAMSSVADDPDGATVLDECTRARDELAGPLRDRIHLACLPSEDAEENAAIVNALQRRATVVVQKSLAEGFGLTVAEAMWKERPVVATRIGGIQDQITDGENGLLIDDPRDLGAFGEAVTSLLNDDETAARMGKEAQERVREDFLGPRHLLQYLELIERILDAPSPSPSPS